MKQIRVPGHPFASYATGYDGIGQFWIVCRCSGCGAEWKKACSNPVRANAHVFKFAVMHGHGVRPSATR